MAKQSTNHPASSLDPSEPAGGDEGKNATPPKSKGTKERGRQGSDNRPICPACTRKAKGKPVLMVAASTEALFTWYACPNRASKDNPEGTCVQPRVKWPRPDQQAQLARLQRRTALDQGIGER